MARLDRLYIERIKKYNHDMFSDGKRLTFKNDEQKLPIFYIKVIHMTTKK